MPPDHPRTAEALLSQSDWVRALVRGLGVDETGAEDVLQSTWIAALTRPPRTAGESASFRAWLARVARNFALRRIDRDARRATRERDTARGERLPSAADVFEREEARAEVVRALLDVHEPYRTTLLLRFYEGLEPRDIARLQGVPDSTVRNRLKRGLALLRERLEATQGREWRQRCLLVLPTLRAAPVGIPKPSKPVAASAAPGGALVIKTLGIATLTAALAGGVYFAWHRAGGERDVRAQTERLSRSSSSVGSSSTTPSTQAPAVDAGRRTGGAPQLVASAPASTRQPAASASQDSGAVPEEDDGHRCSLRGRVLNVDGAPIRSDVHEIQLTGDLESKRDAELYAVAVGGMGAVPAKPAPPVEEGARLLEKRALESRMVELEHAAKIKMDRQTASIAPTLGVPGGGVPNRKAIEAKLVDLVAGAQTYSFALGVGSRPAHVLVACAAGDARELDVASDGSFEFGDLRPGSWSLLANAPGHLARRMTFEIGRTETAKSLDVTLEPSKELRVKLTTPDGADLLEAVTKDPELGDSFPPIPFALRSAPGPRIPDLGSDPERRFASASWRSRDELDEKTVGDASGILELSDALPLHVGVSVRGMVIDERTVAPETEEIAFVVPLEKIRAIASRIALRLVSASEGHPIAGAWVDVAEFPGASTGEDGSVEIASLAPGLRLLRYGADGMESRAEWVRIEAGKRTDLGVRELDAATPVHGRVVDENGAPVQVIVLLHDLDGAASGRTLPICDKASPDAEGRFTFESAGRRRYVATIGGEDWTSSIQTIDARAGAPSDVVVHAARRGELKLTFPIEPPPGSSYVVETRDGIPVAVEPADGWRQLVVRLGDGEYRARLVSDGRTLRSYAVVVRPGSMGVCDEQQLGR